jgi:prefoldin subunit 5
MNKLQRKDLEGLKEKIGEVMEDIEQIRDDEQDKFDNTPENLQDGEQAEKVYQGIDLLEELIDELNTSKEKIDEIIEL